MAHDFEDIHDIDDLNDDELRELVRSQLAANESIDADDITVIVEDGVVALRGRVGTDGEARVAEHIVSDVLGIEQYENELLVDPLRRAESPEVDEEHVASASDGDGVFRGDRRVALSPEAEHLEEDLDARLYGTTDVGESIAQGTAWIPPESPTPEGRDGEEAR